MSPEAHQLTGYIGCIRGFKIGDTVYDLEANAKNPVGKTRHPAAGCRLRATLRQHTCIPYMQRYLSWVQIPTAAAIVFSTLCLILMPANREKKGITYIETSDVFYLTYL